MKHAISILLLLSFVLAGCGAEVITQPPSPEVPTFTETPTQAAVATEEPTITVEATASQPSGVYGPTNFPSDVNPLTGEQVSDPGLLNRRPLAVKISNLPRIVRPQWGLNLADLVFEHYTEEGTTRFTAIFYGNNAEIAGPIRSARFVDAHIVNGYKAVFAFGGAYEKVLNRLFQSDFSDRLVLEGDSTPLYRYDPNVYNHLVVDTAALSEFITQKGVENGRQNLDGMFFQPDAPAGGQAAEQFVVRFSAAIYNRWQYDGTGKYLRFSETTEDFNGGLDEKYEQATDKLTGQPIAFDNVVVLYVRNEYYNRTPEVMDITFLGSGTAYAFRDGQVYQVKWQRLPDAVVTLVNPDGSSFPFKPGSTWFEIIGVNSTVETTDLGIRFVNLMP